MNAVIAQTRAGRFIRVVFSITIAWATLLGVASAGSWPVDTGFESPEYVLGDLNGQNGWITSNSVTVQNTDAYAGLQAVELTSQSQAIYGADPVADPIVWVEGQYKMSPTSDYPDMQDLQGATCVVFYHATDGLTCLDGDGLGTGTWKTTQIQATAWTLIALRQDYANNKWDLYVDGQLTLAGLGNAFNRDSFQKFEFQAGDSGPLFVDDFSAGAYVAPTYTLTVAAENGAVAKSPDQAQYDEGSTVSLTATADAGYRFTQWSGDVAAQNQTDMPLVVAMDADKSITANFEQITHTLIVTAQNGSVTKLPDLPLYPQGSTVTLTAAPDGGYLFAGWTGDIAPAQAASNPVEITMDADKALTATFDPIPPTTYTLTLAAVGDGVANANPDQTVFTEGDTVMLLATPNAGQLFAGWSGDITSLDNPFILTMDADKTITATFEPAPITTYTLTVTTVGDGAVATDPADQTIFEAGSTVTLSATPGQGQKFDGWSGDVTSTDNPLTVIMAADKSITATFSKAVKPGRAAQWIVR